MRTAHRFEMAGDHFRSHWGAPAQIAGTKEAPKERRSVSLFEMKDDDWPMFFSSTEFVGDDGEDDVFPIGGHSTYFFNRSLSRTSY